MQNKWSKVAFSFWVHAEGEYEHTAMFKLLMWISHFIYHILNNSHHSKFLMQLTLLPLILKPISQRGSAYITRHNSKDGSWWYHYKGHITAGFWSVLPKSNIIKTEYRKKKSKYTEVPFSQKAPVKWRGQWQEEIVLPWSCIWWNIPPLWQRSAWPASSSCRGSLGGGVDNTWVAVLNVVGEAGGVVRLK